MKRGMRPPAAQRIFAALDALEAGRDYSFKLTGCIAVVTAHSTEAAGFLARRLDHDLYAVEGGIEPRWVMERGEARALNRALLGEGLKGPGPVLRRVA